MIDTGLSEVNQDDKLNVSAKIANVTTLGLLSIEFNSSMKTDGVNLTHINSTVLDIFIHPEQDRHLEDGYNVTKLNMTWEVTKYSGKLLQI